MIVPDVDWRPMYVAWDNVAAVYTTHWSATGAVILMKNGGEAYTAWCPEAVAARQWRGRGRGKTLRAAIADAETNLKAEWTRMGELMGYEVTR